MAPSQKISVLEIDFPPQPIFAIMLTMQKDTPLPRPEEFRFRCQVEIRFRDLDAMGHVNNAVYFTYFEVARSGYMRALAFCPSEERDLAKLFPFILLEASCRFLAPAVLGQSLACYLRAAHLGSKSFRFEYLLADAKTDAPVAVGQSVQVYFDYKEKKTLPIPEALRRRIEEFESSAQR
jgi:acyl-CoA thioester hydrolase